MEDAQKTWENYYANLRNRRLDEARLVWELMQADGVDEDTVYAMDFSHFSNELEGLEQLASQLSENYEVELSEADERGYFHLSCTTRPYGNELTKDELFGWVGFMCDVAKSYACVFSTWSLECADSQNVWTNKSVESEKYS